VDRKPHTEVGIVENAEDAHRKWSGVKSCNGNIN